MAHTSPVTLSVNAVSELLGVPASTIRGWVRRGVVKSVRIGGRRLISVADIEELTGAPLPQANANSEAAPSGD